ncbi:MAG: MFS transporter [Candidatus Sumerlaeia bacterium]
MAPVLSDSSLQTEINLPDADGQPKANLGQVMSLSLGHLANDFYGNMPQVLLQFIVTAGIGVGRASFLITVFQCTASLTQPLFGLMADRGNKRWLAYAGTAWMSVLLTLMGLTMNYGALVMLCALGGLGTAVFHPTASAMTAACSGRRKGFYQAFWMAAGNVGWALTPIIVVPLVKHGGLRMLPVLMIPGLAVAALLAWNAPQVATHAHASGEALGAKLRAVYPELLRITAVVSGRSVTYFSLVSFVPLFYAARGVSTDACKWWLFVTLLFGALGGMAGGWLSDRWARRDGRRRVVMYSLILSSLFLNVFCMTSGLVSNLALVIGATFLMASFSTTVVLAHQAIGSSAALASGLMIGFAVGIGGLGVGVLGQVAERHGIAAAVRVMACLPLVAGLLATRLKKRQACG